MNVPEIRIGRYILRCPVEVMTGEAPPYTPEQHICISHENGEGMSVSIAKMEAVIDSFYKENF